MPDAPGGSANTAAGPERRGRWRWLSFEGLVSGLNSLGTLWIFALMVIINLDVVGRSVFSAPLPGVPELVKLSIVGIVFLQIGHTLRVGRFVRADVLIVRLQRWRPRIGYALESLFHLAGASLFAILFHASRPFFERAWASGEYEGIAGYVTYPVWPIRLIILIGCAAAVIQYLIFVWRSGLVMLGRRAPPSREPAPFPEVPPT